MSVVLCRFVSDGSVTQSGFAAAAGPSRYNLLSSCAGTAAVVFTDSGYSEVAVQGYTDNQLCSVLVQSPATAVTVTISSFNTEDCCDKVWVRVKALQLGFRFRSKARQTSQLMVRFA